MSLKGRKFTEEHKRKLALAQKGRVYSDETKRKMSESMKGRIGYWLNKKLSNETKQKISKSLKLNERKLTSEHKETLRQYRLGRKPSLETLLKMRASRQKENHPRWIKDRTQLKKSDTRHDSAYKEWWKQCKIRDKWKCKMLNKDCMGKMEVHHILSWAEHIKLRYEVNNGITLCHFHHPRGRKNESKLSPYLQELITK